MKNLLYVSALIGVSLWMSAPVDQPYSCTQTRSCGTCNGLPKSATCTLSGSYHEKVTCEKEVDKNYVECIVKNSDGDVISRDKSYCPDCPSDGGITSDPGPGCDPSSPTWFVDCDPFAT